MSYFLYSAEAWPRPWHPEETREIMMYNGFSIGPVPEKTWYPLQRIYSRSQFESYLDHNGKNITLSDDDMAKALLEKYSFRGVVITEDKYLEDERKKKSLEDAAIKTNIEFRHQVVKEFEQQLKEREITGQGRSKPTHYEEECYEMLDLPKPFSVEAMKAQRQPGQAVAHEIAEALKQLIPQEKKSSPVAVK